MPRCDRQDLNDSATISTIGVTTNIPISRREEFMRGCREGRLEAFKEMHDDFSQYREELKANNAEPEAIGMLDYVLGRIEDLSVRKDRGE